MRTVAQDLRFALRVLRRSPAFTAVTVIVLALGIGANAAIFSVVDAVLLRPLPFRQPERIVALWERNPGSKQNRVSPLNFQDWHDQNTVFERMAAYAGGPKTLQGEGTAEQIPGQAVTLEYFDVLGIQPSAGRFFSPEDEQTGADVIVISNSLWRNRFGGDPRIAGRKLQMDGKPFTVIGVAPPGFQLFWKTDLWSLMVVKRSPEQRRMHYLGVLGRPRSGVSLEQARAGMEPIAAHIAEIAPQTNRGWGIIVEPLRDAMVGGEIRTTALVLAGVVGFVLLMACANVANLMLTRGAARAREMALRVSLGAGSTRLMRQLLTESLLLAVLGGASGLALALLLVRIAPALIPQNTLPVGISLTLDGRVAFFAAALTLATGLLFGLAPAWQVARSSLARALRGGGRTATYGSSLLLAGLAAAEIAIGVVVVAGAGLFLRTLDRLADVDPGFHAAGVLTMHITLPLSIYPTPEKALPFYEAAQREIAALPGVRSAAFGGSLPLTGWNIGQGFSVVGEPAPPIAAAPAAHYQIVGAEYFETLGIPLETGRPFDSRDTGSSQQVAIVNREFVRRYLHGSRAVGRHVRVQAMKMSGPTLVEREIVGVSGQVNVNGLAEAEKTAEIYVPLTQNPWFDASLAVRTAIDPRAMTGAIKAAVARIDKGLALTQVQTMDQIVYQSSAAPRFRARLLGGFAGLALILAAVGIFGVLAFSVSQRTREFGIRMALGANAADVLRIVISRGLKIAVSGIAAGLAGAALLVRALSTLLFGVRPLDTAAFLGAAVILATVALTAAAIPAWRAAHVDPSIALSQE